MVRQMKPLFGIVGHDILLYIYLCSTRQRKEFEAFYCAGISITLAQNFFVSTFVIQYTGKRYDV